MRQTLATWDAEKFKQAYRAKGMTLQQVAVMSGIPYSAIRSYSAGGASPTAPRLVALAQALRVPTTQLAPLRTNFTLHELRWHAGLTVAQVAARVGYSLSHTSLVLSGVSPITAPKVWADALGVSEAELGRAWNSSRAEHMPAEPEAEDGGR